MTNYLAQLRTARREGSFQDVKQALFAVVQGINTLIDERKKRPQHRLKKLGEKLRAVMIPMAIRLAMRYRSSWRIALWRPSREKLILSPDTERKSFVFCFKGLERN